MDNTREKNLRKDGRKKFKERSERRLKSIAGSRGDSKPGGKIIFPRRKGLAARNKRDFPATKKDLAG